MKITKEKLRQIVLEEAVKLEEGQIASTLASVLLPGSGEYGQGAYASNIRDKKMEQRVYERTVLPYKQAYYDIGKEYGISPNLIAGIMMDEDIRRYPDFEGAYSQFGDIFPDIPYGETARKLLAPGKRPAVGMGSTKISGILTDLAQNINPITGEPWLDLDKLIPHTYKAGTTRDDYFGRTGVHPSLLSDAGMAEEVSEWLKKPENAIRVVAARLAYDKERFQRLTGRDLTDQELATGYSAHKKTDTDKNYTASDRGNLAVAMGSEWLKPDVEVEDWWPGEDAHKEVEVEEPSRSSIYDDVSPGAFFESVILDMIKGAIKELL